MNTLKRFLISILLMYLNFSFAHGGSDGGERPQPKKAETESIRNAPASPQPLDYDQIEKLTAEKKFPSDVTAIRCSLNEFSSCRGVEIALYSLSGTLISQANTGTLGVVGFEGLQANTTYIARILSEKYKGESSLASGGVYVINGERQ